MRREDWCYFERKQQPATQTHCALAQGAPRAPTQDRTHRTRHTYDIRNSIAERTACTDKTQESMQERGDMLNCVSHRLRA